MRRINELSPHVADLIAAGEVVERPASVVKELVENSLDAGASSVTVEIRRGGLAYIRVADDGSGLHPDDIPKAFLRHATSKIAEEGDLSAIATLGFRGEALAAIAAVSKIDLFSCTAENPLGRLLELSGGDVVDFREAGCPKGTTIVVTDLFFNTPARLKFLKSDKTEAAYVQSAVLRAALSNPSVAFRFLRDGETIFDTPGDGLLRSAVYSLFGAEFLDGLLPVKSLHEGILVEGYLSKPTALFGNRKRQHLAINGRPIYSRLLTAALEEGYKNRLMQGRFPAAILRLSVHPASLDVNVHPAKTEVKFAYEKSAFDAVYYAVRSALEADDGRPELRVTARPLSFDPVVAAETAASSPAPAVQPNPEPPPRPAASPSAATWKSLFHGGTGEVQTEIRPTADAPAEAVRQPLATFAPPLSARPVNVYPDEEDEERADPAPEVTVPQSGEPTEKATPLLPSFAIRGEAFHTYVLVEEGDDLLLIDKHAAHERILFEELLRTAGNPMAQLLLTPVVHTPDREEYAILLDNFPLARSLGFELEEFGEGTILVRGAPDGISAEDVVGTLGEIAENIRKHRHAPDPKRREELLHSIACKAAMKAKAPSTPEELYELVSKVMTLPDIKYCPHGRPVALTLKRAEIEKHFKRI